MHCIGVRSLDAHERKNLTYRYATAEDLRKFYGEPQRVTTRAVAVLLDGDPVAIIGLAFCAGCAKMFSDTKTAVEPYMRTMTALRAIKFAMTLADECSRDVYAIRQEGTDILPRLGFEQVDNEVYRWRNLRRRSPT